MNILHIRNGKNSCAATPCAHLRRSVSRLYMLAALGILLLSGCTPSLHDTVARGDTQRVEAMLKADPASVGAVNENGKTPLHYAVSYKQIDAMALLVNAGADLNAADKTGMTPLHVAAMLGRRDEATWLLDHGAQIDARDLFGDTPMHTAAIFGAGGAIQVLQARGASLDTKNTAGMTPLDLAKKYKQERVVAFIEKLKGGGV